MVFHFILSGVRAVEVKTTDVIRRTCLFVTTFAGIAGRTLKALNRIKNKNMDLLFCSNDHIEKDYEYSIIEVEILKLKRYRGLATLVAQ